VSFTINEEYADLVLKFLSETKLFALAESLGGVKSLICYPCEMTHKSTPAELRASCGITDSLIRLSVGLENAEDLIKDLENAFLIIKEIKNA
jgi:cystathionine beta-lyase